MTSARNYALVTAAYWAFTLTDGALRMLVLLHFHALGYAPVQLAFLFVFYELFGVVTNLFGGLIAARYGLHWTLLAGLALQVLALVMLSLVRPTWSHAASVAYVMGAQSLSGVAKDLTKMSAKSSLKVLIPEGQNSVLFRWVAVLTGSKNALKGAGFFAGGALLTYIGYMHALLGMAAVLVLVLVGAALSLPNELGKAKTKPKFKGMMSKSRAVNVLSAARFFLFGARDVWFVVGVPVFLSASLGFTFTEVGSFLAAWVIGYGIVQSFAPAVIGRFTAGRAPEGLAARVLAFGLALLTGGIALGVYSDFAPKAMMLGGLGLFAVVFAINSSVHSYLILAYSDGDKVAMNVGFYYMANAAGRLLGTVLSGLLFQLWGVLACLWGSALLAAFAGLVSIMLPRRSADIPMSDLQAEGASG